MIYMLRDLTRAHNDLERAKAYTENIIESMADTLIVVDLNGRIGCVNKATLDLLKYKEKELIGKPLHEIMVSAKGGKTANKIFRRIGLRELMAMGRVKDMEVTYVSKSGKNIPISLSSALMKDSKVELQEMVCVAKDLSERKRAEEKLRLAHESLSKKSAELEEANLELSQYTYAVSHDLKAPLRAIHNYADFLREDLEGTLEKEQKEYLDGLGETVRQAKELVDDLLQLSRLGRKELEYEKVNLGEFLERLIASLNLPSEIEVVMGNNWPTIDTEPTLLGQILQNLITNAIKFNKSAAKQVELGYKSLEEKGYELFVRDNGIGIEPQYQKQIFRMFQRLHTTKEYEGTGIGLALVMKATSRMGGSVRVESKSGEGSTFFVTLPGNEKEI